MGFLQRISADYEQRYPSKPQKLLGQSKGPQPPGGFSLGTGLYGGPLFTDNYGGRRAPAPWQLIEKYKSLVYAMASRNEKAVCRVPLRLYADGSRAQGGKPTRWCDPIKATRSVARDLCARGLASPSAVDSIYEVRQHGVIDLIDRPDPYGYFNRTALLSLIVRYNDIVGGAWFCPEGPGWGKDAVKSGAKGPPEYLWALYSQYVYPIRAGGSPLVSVWQYFASRIPFEDALWFRQNISLRDPYGSGFSPTYASDMYSDLEDKWVSLQDQILGLGPMPRMMASAKDPMMPPGRDEAIAFRQDMKRQQSGGMAGGFYVNTGAWDITPMSYAPTDLSGMDMTTDDKYKMAAVFDQPATYYTVDSNLANLEAADAQHAKMGVEPRCRNIADALTQFTRMFAPQLFWAFDSCLAEDDESKQRVIDMQLKSGQITINQANEESRWPPVEYGNEAWLPSTLKQPSMIQAEHQMAQTQAASQIRNEQKATDFQYSDDAEEDVPPGEAPSAEARAAPSPEEIAALAELRVLTRAMEAELRLHQGAGIPYHEAGPGRFLAPPGDVRFHGGAGNPYHDENGHFTDPGGVGHAAQEAKSARAPEKHHAKNQRKKKKKALAKGVKGGGGGKAGLTDRERKGKPEVLSEKAQRAQLHQNKTTKVQQEYAKKNEFAFATKVGGEAFPDNGPIDVEMKIGKGTHGIELKTLTHGKNDKLTMKGEALERKAAWQKETGGTLHTVALDHRDKIAGSESLHSGHEIYYRRGAGSFRIGTMYKVKDIDELHKLMKMPADKLPAGAK